MTNPIDRIANDACGASRPAAVVEDATERARQRILTRTREEVAAAMDMLRDNAECCVRSIDARIYWFGVMEGARKEYVKASPLQPHRPEDYRPGGCNYEKHAAEERAEREAAERERRGIIADETEDSQ